MPTAGTAVVQHSTLQKLSCEHERKVSGREGGRERWEGGEEGIRFIRIVVGGGPPGSKLLRSHAKLSLCPLRSMHAVV